MCKCCTTIPAVRERNINDAEVFCKELRRMGDYELRFAERTLNPHGPPGARATRLAKTIIRKLAEEYL